MANNCKQCSIGIISHTTTPLPKAYDCVAVYIAGRRTSLVVILYYSGDIVEENDHLSFWSAKNRYLMVTGVTIKFHKFIAELNYELNNNNKRCE